MGHPAHTLDSFDVLRSEPIRWVLTQLSTYVVVIAITGLTFLATAGVYTNIWGPPTQVAPIAVPVRKPPTVVPETKPVSPPIEGALISRLEGKEIGVPVLLKGDPFGVVVEVKEDAQGQARTLVVQPFNDAVDGKAPATIEVPYSTVQWHSKDQGTQDWVSNNERIRATFKSLWIELDSSSVKFLPAERSENR